MAPSTPTPHGDPGRAKPAGVPIGFGSLLRAVRRYSLLVFVFALLAIAAGAVVWFFLPLPKMTAQMVYFVNGTPPYKISANVFGEKDAASYRTQQANLFKNRFLLNAVLQEPGIATLLIFEQGGIQEPVDWLRNNLRVDWTLGPEHMRIVLEGDNQAELMAIMNAVKTTYEKKVAADEGNMRNMKLAEIEKLQQKYQLEIKNHRMRIRNNLNIAGGGASDPVVLAIEERFATAAVGSIDSEMVRLNALERDLSLQLTRIKSEMGLPKALVSPVTPEMVDSILENDPVVIGLTKRLSENTAQIQSIVEKLPLPVAPKDLKEAPGKPARLLTLEKEKAEIEAELKKYKDTQRPLLRDHLKEIAKQSREALKTRVETELTFVREKKQEVQKEMKEAFTKLTGLREQNEKVEDMKSMMLNYEKLVDKLNQSLVEMMPETDVLSRVQVWEPPYTFYGIEGNRRFKYTAMAVIGFLLLGLVLAQYLELRHRRIQNLDEITNGLGLKVLGTVPAMPKGGVNAGSNWPHLLTEAVNTTRTMLLSGPNATNNKTLLVTSAMSGEGKTSLTTHLAVSLANAGRRVMLIDADMRRPAVHRVLGLTSKPGLAELLIGLNQLSEVVQECKIPNLHLLPAGTWSREAAAALSSDAWPRVLHEASQGFDFVLVDSPPILPVADALAIARNVDGVLISIMQDQSRYGAVQTACQRLNMVGAKVLGVVVSGMKTVGGYYYYYYYDERYSKPNAHAAARAAEEAAEVPAANSPDQPAS
jgi:polysaccharide biosynthesis transport protein